MQDWKLDRPPMFDELPEMDVLFSFEPSRTWVGAAIRQELSQTEHPYGCAEVAQAFSLDRQIQYRKLNLPALAAGKIIIQDRSVSSSLVYQPLMPNALSLDQVAALPGNAFAIEHAPNHLILTSLPVDTIVERIKSRTDDSKGVWQDIELLRRADQEYRSEWFRELFESHGTELHSLDTGKSIEESRANAVTIIESILNLL